MTVDDVIRRAEGRVQLAPPPHREPARLAGVDGGHHAPRQPERVDMDKHIRARAGKGPQPIGTAPDGIPLSLG
jgi:hypothetical protein